MIKDAVRKAVGAGARLRVALNEIPLSQRTWRRWQTHPEAQRPQAVRPEPANRLTSEEEEQILAVCHQPEYARLPPSQIVPRLADNGVYLASESTFYRVLRRHGEVHHRGRKRTAHKSGKPTTWTATAPQSALGMGYYVAPVNSQRPLVLSVYDTRYFQPENRGL
ncbi:putative transposase [Xenorhabdus nematophila ATCC 19061]|uniref:Transposase n=1 Tax=Xenorhabdus nematophila (strain ATCC 19061 / DSM 3370 / CCUG 14189 / LMG 1036 / NCIMB 9965 / AN6) TaxID=406817 RepID=D3VE66_XENNA|nr:putative transposase [Xenorhabdus nematophila ATCC 19061]CEK25131.1 putative transposase [Xenorhabdus nematophila AN6/1]